MWFHRGFLFVMVFCYAGASNIEDIESPNNYELLDDEQLIQDTIIHRNPIALLIDDSCQNFQNVLEVVQKGYFNASDLWLVTFNNSGVSTVWEKSFNNIKEFYNTLNSLASQSRSQPSPNQSLPVFALFQTAKVLPKDSALIIFSNAYMNEDKHLENNALNIILSKNITVYTVNEKQHFSNSILHNIRSYSGGRKLIVNQKPEFENYKYHAYETPSNVSLIFSKKNLRNSRDMSFPIDSAVTAIHITIKSSSNTKGVLTSPSEYKFSFSNKTKSIDIKYSQGSIFENFNGLFEMHLNFSTSSRPTVGIWTLHLENSQEPYNVTVFAFSNIAAHFRFSEEGEFYQIISDSFVSCCHWVISRMKILNKSGLLRFLGLNIPKDVMKLGVTGNISHITDVSLLDSNGETVLGNVSYKFNNKYVTQSRDNVPDIKNNVVSSIEISNELQLPKHFYALIKGKDVKGNVFQRLSYFLRKNDIYPIQTLTVDVGLGSQLVLSSSTTTAEIYFVVSNLGTTALLVTFSCSDSKYILNRLSILRRYLEPQESTIVTLYLNPRSGTYQDEITFFVKSSSQVVQKKILVDIGSQIIDETPPELDYNYISDCTEVIFASCSKGTWTIEITAHDVDSGLLHLTTYPTGLYFPYAYISGTKDYISGHYSDSCCNPNLQISAVDRLHNSNSYSVNAYKARLGPGLIAAIVLGILLFVVLVTVITVVLVRKYKSKESYDLPTYRGGGI
ncbi:uncharacterized protein [Euwallacea similis]|uniref:uncharacterized protein n=1 Tax=Euwallacea similis TaxID=1736056 RepID=UPI00344C2D66